MKARIWVTGSQGLIGNSVLQHANAQGCGIEGVPVSRSLVDLRDHEMVESLYQRDRPTGVIHCAAISNTGVCEGNPRLAAEINTNVTRVLSDLAGDVPFVFLSTDLVFDGLVGNYREEATCRPINVYGETKRAAEEIVLANPRHCVVRLSLNGGISPTGDRGFNELLHRDLSGGKEVKLFTDEFRQPLPAVFTASVIWQLVLNGATGIYHLGGAERMSRYEIGKLLAHRWALKQARIVPASLKDFKGGRRAPDTSMDCERIRSELGITIPSLREWLEKHPTAPF